MAHRPSLRNTALRLQDGGVVPGSGRGDKIPAKYEPGEFVVSNDMIDDNPGLREQLSNLRAETLAARGKTVEEADAKALRGGPRPSLRAADGFTDEFYRGQAAPVDRAAAQASTYAARSAAVPPSATMTQGVDGVAPPGQKYPGRDLVVAGNRAVVPLQTAPVSPTTALTRTSDIGSNGYKPNFTMGGTGAPAPQPFTETPRNPGMANPQAQAAYDDMARARVQPAAPTVEPAAPKPPGAASKWFGSADGWKNFTEGPADSPHKTLRMAAPEAPSKFGKGVLALQGAMGAKDAYDGIQEGDAWKTGVGAADAVAGAALFTPAAPAAGAYLGLRGAYDTAKAAGGAIYDNLSDKAKDVIGGTFNQIGLNTGLWGEDDSAKLMADAQARLAKPADTPRKTTPSAAPDPRNPYADTNAAKIAASDAQNKTAGQPQPQAGGYGPIGDRTTLTNEQAAVMNPAGRVTMKRGANGIMELSGGNVSGQVSYNDADGKALAGGGLRGKGFSNFDVAPAGANVVTGPNGYAFATSGSGLRGQGGGGGPQMLGGVDVSGLSGAQAMQYADEVRNAQRINDSQQRIREASAGGGSGGTDLRSPEYLAARNASVTSTISRDGRPRLRSEVEAETARARMALDAQNAQMQNQTTLRGQDINAETSRYGYDNSLRGTMYSSDATLGAKRTEMQQRLQQQQLKGAIFREAGGKPEVAAKIAAMYGMDAKDFTDMAAAEQTRAQSAATSARKRLEGMAVVRNEKGEDVVSEGRVANLERTLTKMAPGWQHMSEPEQAELYGKAEASVNLLEGLNDRRNNSFWQSIGVDGKSASLDNLPDMKGGRLTTVKLLEGAMTGGGVSRGDYALEVGGHKLYLPRDKVNQGELELLKARGVDISGMQK